MIKKILFVISLLLSTQAMAQGSKIAAIVNGEIITSSDLDDRFDNFLFMSKMPVNEQTKPMIKQQVLHQAIDEKLKILEAQKNGLKISEKEVDDAIKSFEKKHGQLSGGKVSKKALRSQIKADLAWSKLMGQKSFEAKNITQKEIEVAMEAALKDINSPKRMVSEIYILKNKAKNLSELVEILREDDRFELYARQFSDAPSAGNAGKLGWINNGRFEPVIEKALSKMKEGDVSNPILSGNGYYILKLEKIFDPKKEKAYIPSEDEIKAFLQNKNMERLMQAYTQNMRQNASIEFK